MAQSMLRVMGVVPNVKVGCPTDNAQEIIKAMAKVGRHAADIVVFPELCLTGTTCGDLFMQSTLQSEALDGLDQVAKASVGLGFIVVVSLPLRVGGMLTAVSAVIDNGRILSFIPSVSPPAPLKKCDFAPMHVKGIPILQNVMFRFASGESFGIIPSPDLNTPPIHEMGLRASGCDAVISPVAIASFNLSGVESKLSHRADQSGMAIALVGAGAYESSYSHVYRGFCACAEPSSVVMVDRQNEFDPLYAIYDIDIDIVRSAPSLHISNDAIVIELSATTKAKDKLYRTLSATPYLPTTASEQLEFYKELFESQSIALASRLKAIGLSKVILGVSGGLDSTLALLVASRTFDMLGLARENIIAVTMPGFGTTGRTYNNALAMIRELGASLREVDISESVLLHFKEIGHDKELHNATYENAQARERTQILFDMANTDGALVLGTGDLSEIALGWCTFGGDHLAGYGVNSCLTKGMVRGVVAVQAELTISDALRATLQDVLDTPVSPELLPGGNEVQGTENILGPYELHDFLLFHTINYGFAREKLLLYAKTAFPEIGGERIEGYLVTFAKRFVSSQFKRACSTESPRLTAFNLHDYKFPSDMPRGFVL